MPKFLVVEVQEEIVRRVWHYENIEAETEAEAIDKANAEDGPAPVDAGTIGEAEFRESGWAAGDPMEAFELAEHASDELDERL